MPHPFNGLLKNFPFSIKDGKCEKFIDGKCSVYENRPIMCNVEKLYDTYIKTKNHTESDKIAWFRVNKEFCKIHKKERQCQSH